MNQPRAVNSSTPSFSLSGDGPGIVLPRLTCFICRKEIVEGRWFSRVSRQGKNVLLCTPSCALTYFETLQPAKTGYDDGSRSEPPIHLSAHEKPW